MCYSATQCNVLRATVTCLEIMEPIRDCVPRVFLKLGRLDLEDFQESPAFLSSGHRSARKVISVQLFDKFLFNSSEKDPHPFQPTLV